MDAKKLPPVPNAAPYKPNIGIKIEFKITFVKKIESIKILCNLGISDIEKILKNGMYPEAIVIPNTKIENGI